MNIDLKVLTVLEYFEEGTSLIFNKITITKKNSFEMNAVIHWEEGYCEPIILASTIDNLKDSVSEFEKRFGIEPMFKE